ncbi:MAG: hypothetical protein IIB94_03690 [Candidatus Marinimicrobia bacterium]|nr:hypothetical protein [Candidatus Neomarinimicrobiota bacterium]
MIKWLKEKFYNITKRDKHKMSTSRNMLQHSSNFEKDYIKKFDFYLDALDKIFTLQGSMGLEREQLSSLTDEDQKIFKSYLFLVESSNTTSIGALRLFMGNIYSDALALIRILYEIACIMHYGNKSYENKLEVYESIFKSDVPANNHSKKEWNFTRKAQRLYESENPGLKEIKSFINNFGSHISRSKVVTGNITSQNDTSISILFTPNYNKKEFLLGLDVLSGTMAMILEEFAIYNESCGGISSEIMAEVKSIPDYLIKTIRPKLFSFMDGQDDS